LRGGQGEGGKNVSYLDQGEAIPISFDMEKKKEKAPFSLACAVSEKEGAAFSKVHGKGGGGEGGEEKVDAG